MCQWMLRSYRPNPVSWNLVRFVIMCGAFWIGSVLVSDCNIELVIGILDMYLMDWNIVVKNLFLNHLLYNLISI